LNKAFETLANKLPNYSASWSKIEILQKALEYIVEMEEKHQNSGANDAEWKSKVIHFCSNSLNT
jgi:Helix-loop-helix DNA-binding domain